MKIRRSGRFQKGIKLLSKEPKLVGIKMQNSAQGRSPRIEVSLMQGLGWAQQWSNCRQGPSFKSVQDEDRDGFLARYYRPRRYALDATPYLDRKVVVR